MTPNPDTTSDFPTQYCKTCGAGWLQFSKCERRNGLETACDFTGEVVGSFDWSSIKKPGDKS